MWIILLSSNIRRFWKLASFEAAKKMKKRMAPRLLKRPGIYGVGVGYKDPSNPNKGAALIIYANKVSAKNLGLTPAMFSMKSKGKSETVPIRIVKCGKMKACQNYRSRIRPVPPGYSVGTSDGSGSVGLIITRPGQPGSRYLLSNNHVLNPSNGTRAVDTLQPGGADGGTPNRDRIGRLYRYVRLSSTRRNYIDAALTIPLRPNLLNPRYPTVGMLPGHVTSYRVGERFKKVGRTTGLTYGTVESVDTDVNVNYGRLGTLSFVDQTIVRGTSPVSLPGDSGSVWLRRSDGMAAAVNFAGSADGRISIAFPVHWAMRSFGTVVARPNRAGIVKHVKRKQGGAPYVRQLTSKELARIRSSMRLIRKK